jgi:hypothetical protein
MVGFRIVALMSLLLLPLACGSDPDPIETEGPDAGAIEGEPTFMEPCDIANDACEEPYFCFHYNMNGPHCTKECTLDEQCEAPSRGCNMMGVCKSP